MTKRYTYALKTIMLLYDGLFEACQAFFVTSFGEHSAIRGQLLVFLYTLTLYICFNVILPKQSTFGPLPSRAKELTSGHLVLRSSQLSVVGVIKRGGRVRNPTLQKVCRFVGQKNDMGISMNRKGILRPPEADSGRDNVCPSTLIYLPSRLFHNRNPPRPFPGGVGLNQL